jgi:hypothetical protein
VQAAKERGKGADREQIDLNGVVQKAEGAPYGTHTVEMYGEPYALTSENVDLDEYVGRDAKLYGELVEGYAAPRLVNVTYADPAD